MAIGLAGAMIIGHFNGSMVMPEMTLQNLHPSGLSIFPFLFTTIACGALSGFHSTQSPMMARCINRESESKRVFYGAMVVEGIVALIWCAVTIAFFGESGVIQSALDSFGGQSGVVSHISKELLGPIGAVLAVLGVVACPITSGDTAFRSARLTLADWFGIDQGKFTKRLILCVPLLAVGAFVGHLDYTIIWRYFSWTNQTLAMIVLWTASMFLFKEKKNYWITAVPATFMSAVSMTYFFYAKECLNLGTKVAYPAGIIIAAVFFGIFMYATRKQTKAAN